MKLFKIRNQNEYLDHVVKSREYLAMIQRTENSMIPNNGRKRFSVKGYSYTAGCEVDFKVGTKLENFVKLDSLGLEFLFFFKFPAATLSHVQQK